MRIVALALALAVAAPAGAQVAIADAEWVAYEAKVLAALEARTPGAVADARAAGEAYAAQRWEEALAGYRRVLASAPGFSHALRRACAAQLFLGAHADAVASCRDAVAADPLPENLVALARALLATAPAGQRPKETIREANGLAQDALARANGRPDRAITAQICDVAIGTDDRPLLSWCSAALRRMAPDAAETHYFAAIDAATDGDMARAVAEVEAARAAGLPGHVADAMRAAFAEAEPPVYRYARRALWATGAWAAALLLLVGLGAALSRATLREASRLAQAPAGTDSAGSRALRRTYGAVLFASCAFYYVSVPLALVAVLALGAGVLWGFSYLGEIPVKVVLILAVVVIVTAVAVAKSLWVSIVRPREVDPGARLVPGRHPRLDQAVRAVAERVGTRPVDAVFLTPGAEVAVFERGGLWRQLAGRSERCLILGVGVLDGMTEGELKAVLAHEYGHLVNRDTAGGGFALAVRRSILTMAQTLGEGGAATWYNPAWWFVWGYNAVFLRVSQGASRLQEILADRWAALAYGGDAFARGLEHAIAQAVRFDRHVDRTVREVIERERALANVYRYEPAQAEDPEELEAAIAAAIDAEPTPYDSHPRARDRIAWTSGVASAGALEMDDTRPAWSLFADRERLEEEMTDRLRHEVAARNGVTIPAEPPEAAAAEAGAVA